MFQIVISKLRQQTALDHDRRHLKAAKVSHCHCVIYYTILCIPGHGVCDATAGYGIPGHSDPPWQGGEHGSLSGVLSSKVTPVINTGKQLSYRNIGRIHTVPGPDDQHHLLLCEWRGADGGDDTLEEEDAGQEGGEGEEVSSKTSGITRLVLWANTLYFLVGHFCQTTVIQSDSQ